LFGTYESGADSSPPAHDYEFVPPHSADSSLSFAVLRLSSSAIPAEQEKQGGRFVGVNGRPHSLGHRHRQAAPEERVGQ